MLMMKYSYTDSTGWSRVHGFFDGNNLVAKIEVDGEIYVIEVCNQRKMNHKKSKNKIKMNWSKKNKTKYNEIK